VHPGLLSELDPAVFHVLVGRHHGENVVTGIAFDFHADCGIYNIGTLELARRPGLATALTLTHLHDALARGCQTASLQSTSMAERLYTTVGLRDLGQLLEYAPPQRDAAQRESRRSAGAAG
jgi:hypothetical protein